MDLPETIETEEKRIELLTRPSPALVECAATWNDPLVILGAGGKMGPTLAVLAQRALKESALKEPTTNEAAATGKVVAVSRFSDTGSRQWLESEGVQTIQADLLEPQDVMRLPESSNVVYLVGLKFGTRDDPAATWATNVIPPQNVFQRYPAARMVALSTGNVYPLSAVSAGGSVESDPLTPLGEYSNAAVARERVFEFLARRSDAPLSLIRLNYAHDLRYGVINDIALCVAEGRPVDLTMGYFNAIWQGDANDFVLRSLQLADVPPRALNVTSPEICSVRATAETLGELLGRDVSFTGEEAGSALISNCAQLEDAMGQPQVPPSLLIRWIANWIKKGHTLLNRPTRFEVRDGAF